MNTHSLDLELSSSQFAYITDANQTGLDITGDISIECWIKFESLPVSICAFVSKYTTSNQSYLFNVYNASGEYRLVMNYSSNGTADTSSYIVITPSTGVWYHYAATADVSAHVFEFYINGISQGAGTEVGTMTSIRNGTAEVMIGAYGVHTSPLGKYDGLIDEVRIWNDIRTDEEIAANFKTDVLGQTGLAAYWKFNNSALDETENNNDLTLSGSPVYSTDVPFAKYTNEGGGGYFHMSQ